MSPQVSALVAAGLVEARSTLQIPMFEACQSFVQSEGILPAPEAGHAVWGALQEALAAREAGEERVVVFSLSGHGHFDLSAYDDFKSGRLVDYEYPEEAIHESLAALPDAE